MDYLAVQMLDGRQVHISERAIATISEPQKSSGQTFAGKVSCVVTLLDGKFVAVAESCAAIRERLKSR
jgi:hypothetical protein